MLMAKGAIIVPGKNPWPKPSPFIVKTNFSTDKNQLSFFHRVKFFTSSGKRRYCGDGQLRISSRTLCSALVDHHAKQVWISSPLSTPVFSNPEYIPALFPSSQMFPVLQSASGWTQDWNCYFWCLLQNFCGNLCSLLSTLWLFLITTCWDLYFTKNWQIFMAFSHFMY